VASTLPPGLPGHRQQARLVTAQRQHRRIVSAHAVQTAFTGHHDMAAIG
jgi:hypothetical protein